jgi:PAS domain S-box-containing protein
VTEKEKPGGFPRGNGTVPDSANILLVDDKQENLFALQAILEPLGQNLLLATSGEEALRRLLVDDVAVILLDVRMSGLDGFETATLIKQRERTRAIPIIFLTAVSTDEAQIFRGYSAGAVDYLLKPFDPDVLRSKVSVFVELHQKRELVNRQSALLRERELADAVRASEARYRALADAMPQIVWTAGADGKATYYNRRWFEYTGLEPGPLQGDEWIRILHADDLPPTLQRRKGTLETGKVFEAEYRLRAADGSYRWHLGRAVPLRGANSEIEFWVGTATDIDAQKRTEQAQDFLLRAGIELTRSLDYKRSLQAVAKLAVPEIADWCAIDLLEEDGEIHSVALTHVDQAKVTFARELTERYAPKPESGSGLVIKTGETQFVPEITEELLTAFAVDEPHIDLLRELGLRSYMCVPIVIRERILGAITFVDAESGRRFDAADLKLAEELGRRAGAAVENARLYRAAEERAQAARVLAAIGDGVVLLDSDGVIRLWNQAAEAITGLRREDVIGRPASRTVPGIEASEPGEAGPNGATPHTVPVEVDGRELWLSVIAVAFEDGAVYAFRDLTQERALERMRQDLVSTVSHELRTPLAAIYGSALTLGRTDLALDQGVQQRLLGVIAEESARLAAIVNDLLLAGQLDAGPLDLRIEHCDAQQLVEGVVEAARLHAPENVAITFAPPALALAPVAADEGKLRQVIANLVDNAVRYSPEGGGIEITLEPADRNLRLAIADRGLGIPAGERERIFEKFYRLDPDMSRGIGGTGLGLYICRELVRRVQGRIWVEPNDGRGSVFYVEIPFAHRSSSNEPATA